MTSSERPCIPRRRFSVASLHETEVSGSQNRIKMELESEEEYAELGPSNTTTTMPKVEPLEEGHFVDSLEDREMCRVYYDSLTEVKPPVGIIPFPVEEGEMPHLRFTWRMFLLVGTLRLVICLNKSLHYLIHKKNVRCVLMWGLGPLPPCLLFFRSYIQLESTPES